MFYTGFAKSSGELLCQKCSTGTFLRENLLGSVKRGSGLGRSPSKCFRISHPLLRFFKNKGVSLSADSDEGLHPSTPQAFEKGLTETLTFVLICAFFLRKRARRKSAGSEKYSQIKAYELSALRRSACTDMREEYRKWSCSRLRPRCSDDMQLLHMQQERLK